MSKTPLELLADAIALVPEPDALREKILELAPCRLSEVELDKIVNYIGNINAGIMLSVEEAMEDMQESDAIRQAVIHEQLAALRPGG